MEKEEEEEESDGDMGFGTCGCQLTSLMQADVQSLPGLFDGSSDEEEAGAAASTTYQVKKEEEEEESDKDMGFGTCGCQLTSLMQADVHLFTRSF